MATIRQPTFTAGELAPLLHGRTDLPRYAAGLRRAFNFFVAKQGPAITRPGATFLGYARATTVDLGPISGPHDYVTSGTVIRLIPFYFSDTDTSLNAVLEFGAKYYRVWSGGSVVLNAYYGPPQDFGDTPYLPADLRKIRYVQSGDTLYLTCPGYPAMYIKRQAANIWAVGVIDFSRPLPVDIDTTTPTGARIDESTIGEADAQHPAKAWDLRVTEIRRQADGSYSESTPLAVGGLLWYGQPWNPLVTYKKGTVANAGGTGASPYVQSVQNGNLNNAPPVTGGDSSWWHTVTIWDAGITYAAGDWVVTGGVPAYKQSLQNGNTNHPITDGTWWGSATPVTQWQSDDFGSNGFQAPVFPDRPLTVELPTVTAVADPALVTFRIYAGRGGVFGWIGDSNGPFVWDGSAPDFATAPPEGNNPFEVYDPASMSTRTEYPTACGFYQDRLVLAGTAERPAFLFGSGTGDYTNFDSRLVPTDTDALLIALAARRQEIIRSLAGHDTLYVLTNAALWAVSGGQGAPLSPGSIDARLQVDIGADWAPPLVIDDTLIWVRDKGTGVRGIKYDFEQAKFVSSDLSMSAEHLVLGHQIVEWCFQEDPWGVVWAIREDGLLLSLTLSPDDQLWAWAQHGVCASIANPDGSPGQAGVLQSICTIPEGDEDAVYLAMTGSAPPVFSLSTTYALGQMVQQTSGGGTYLFASLSAGNIGHAPNSDGSSSAYWSRVYTPPAWMMRMTTRQEISGLKEPVPLDGFLEFDGPVVTVVGGNNVCVISGLDHLEGRSVWGIADGAPVGPSTVVGGRTTLVLSPHVVGRSVVVNVLYVGLPFVAELETLDMPQGRGAQKVVNEVALELDMDAGSSVKAGADLAHLKPSPVWPPKGGDNLLRVQTAGTWNSGGRMAIRVDSPELVTILGITRKVAAGDE